MINILSKSKDGIDDMPPSKVKHMSYFGYISLFNLFGQYFPENKEIRLKLLSAALDIKFNWGKESSTINLDSELSIKEQLLIRQSLMLLVLCGEVDWAIKLAWVGYFRSSKGKVNYLGILLELYIQACKPLLPIADEICGQSVEFSRDIMEILLVIGLVQGISLQNISYN